MGLFPDKGTQGFIGAFAARTGCTVVQLLRVGVVATVLLPPQVEWLVSNCDGGPGPGQRPRARVCSVRQEAVTAHSERRNAGGHVPHALSAAPTMGVIPVVVPMSRRPEGKVLRSPVHAVCAGVQVTCGAMAR